MLYLPNNRNFSLLLIALLLLGFNRTVYADGLTDLKDSLNKGKINTTITEPLEQPLNEFTEKSKNTHKNTIPALLKNPENIYFQNYKKIKVKGKNDFIIVPWIDQNSYKKFTSKKTTKPLRIGSKLAIPYVFNFPQNSNEPTRLEAEKYINNLANLISSITPANFSSKYNEVINLVYGKILPDFGQYPDICAIAKFYVVEANVKNYQDAYCSGDNPYKWLEQIKLDYQKQKNYNSTMEELLIAIAERQNKMIQNNGNLKLYIDSIKEDQINLKSDISYYINFSYYNKNQTYGAIESINNNFSYIFSNYLTLIDYYNRTGDVEKSKSIFDINISGEKIEFKGEFYEFYKNIPYSISLKFTHDEFGNPIDGSSKNIIQKPAVSFLKCISAYCNGKIDDLKSDQFIDGNNNNIMEEKIKKIYSFVNTYSPSAGNESENQAEETLTVYEQNQIKSSIPVQRRKISKVYFCLEYKELNKGNALNPDDTFIIRCTGDYGLIPQKFATEYAFKNNIYANQSKRYKQLTFKYDYFYGGYYSKLKANENDNSDNPTPTITKLKANKNFTPPINYDIHPNIINCSKDAHKNSIACFNSGAFIEELYAIYKLNKFFYSGETHNHTGYSINFDTCDNQITLKGKDLFEEIISQASNEFIKAGGGEYMFCYFQTWPSSTAYPDGTTELICNLAANQADWFIVDSHGTGTAGEIISNNDRIYVPMKNLFNNNGTSKYSEDMDVLILGICYALNFRSISDPLYNELEFARGWHKVLNDGVVLGYTRPIYPSTTKSALKNLNKALTLAALNSHELSKEEIAEIWMDANAEVYNEYLNNRKSNIYLEPACRAANIYNNNWQTVAEPPKIIKVYKKPFNYRKFIGEPNPNKTYYSFIMGPKYDFEK